MGKYQVSFAQLEMNPIELPIYCKMGNQLTPNISHTYRFQTRQKVNADAHIPLSGTAQVNFLNYLGIHVLTNTFDDDNKDIDNEGYDNDSLTRPVVTIQYINHQEDIDLGLDEVNNPVNQKMKYNTILFLFLMKKLIS